MSILIQDGEFIQLEGTLAEINRLLGRTKITTHESDADKVRISGSEVPLLDGAILNQQVRGTRLKFDGAVIDFTTGQIFEADGTTPLGVDFIPPIIPVGEFLWFAISVNPTSTFTTLNETFGSIGVEISASSDLIAANAEVPSFCGSIQKLGWVQIQNNGGTFEVSEIRRLSVGTGGDTSGDSVRDIYNNRLDFSLFQTVSATVFSQDGNSFTDPASTGSLANNCFFSFSAGGQTYLDLNNSTSADFIAAEADLFQVELFARWDEDAIDPAAVYELSRDGGNEYQSVDMVRVGTDSNAFRGFHIFSEEAANQTIEEQLTPNASRELTDTGVGVRRAVQIPIPTASVMKTISLDFNKTEAVVGNLNGSAFKIQMVLDDAGTPSTSPNDIISETPNIDMTIISSGDSTYLVTIPEAVKTTGSLVWAIISTDATYKAAFTTGVDALSIRVNTLTPHHIGAEFTGLVWTPTVEAWGFQLSGRALDLRLRVTSSIPNVRLESYGLYYHEQSGTVANTGAFDIDVFSFLGDDNVTNFPLVNIQDPIPGLVEAFDETEGNAYLNGSSTYQILGNTLVFAANFFNRPGQNLTLKVRQLKAGIIDNSDPNAANIAINSLAITDIRNNQDKYGVGGGVANAYTLTLTPPITSLIDGQIFYFTIPASNTASLVTLAVDGTGVKSIAVNEGGGASSPSIIIGQLALNSKIQVQYDVITDRFIILSGGQSLYGILQDEGSSLPRKRILNFVGAGVVASDSGDRTTVTIPGGNPNAALVNAVNNFSAPQFLDAGVRVNGGIGVNAVIPAAGVIRCTGFIQADGGYHQPGTGGETLKIIRGTVTSGGAISVGGGYTSVRNSLGVYTITFNTVFSSVPSAVGAAEGNLARIFNTFSITTGSFQVEIRDTNGNLADSQFGFIVVGATS